MGRMEKFKKANEELKNMDGIKISSFKHKFSNYYEVQISNDSKKGSVVDDAILLESININFDRIKKDMKKIYKDNLKKLYAEAKEEAYEFIETNNKTEESPLKKKIWDVIDLGNK